MAFSSTNWEFYLNKYGFVYPLFLSSQDRKLKNELTRQVFRGVICLDVPNASDSASPQPSHAQLVLKKLQHLEMYPEGGLKEIPTNLDSLMLIP
jgi:hypothetical protein